MSYTFSPYILLLSLSFPLCFNIGLDVFSVVLLEKNDKLGLHSEDVQMLSSESQFHDLGVYIDSDLGCPPPNGLVVRSAVSANIFEPEPRSGKYCLSQPER